MLSVLDSKFWEDRLKDSGDEVRLSVYRCSQDEWDRINTSHQRILSELIPPESIVLDIGCGYGRYSPMFGSYIGIDLSDAFIAKAKKMYPGKVFMAVDITKGIPFKDKSIEWGFSVSLRKMVIREAGEEVWNQMEKEITRVCKNYVALEYTDYNERYIK